eukprot:Gb_22378 [translate_table: standard]
MIDFYIQESLWVDLCHQATDKEEEEEEEDDDMDYVVLPEHQGNKPIVNPPHAEKHRRCCSIWRRSHIRSRQKFVIAVVLLICVLTVTFSVLIWIGTGRNPINSSTLAQACRSASKLIVASALPQDLPACDDRGKDNFEQFSLFAYVTAWFDIMPSMRTKLKRMPEISDFGSESPVAGFRTLSKALLVLKKMSSGGMWLRRWH